MKKHKINISKMIFKSWDKHTEIWCRIAFMLMIPSALSRVFATICIIFGFVLLAIIRKGYEEYWHLDDVDKEKYHEFMALLVAINDDFEGGQENDNKKPMRARSETNERMENGKE